MSTLQLQSPARRRPWPIWLIIAYLSLNVVLALPALWSLRFEYPAPPIALYALGGLGIVSSIGSCVALFKLEATAIPFLALLLLCTAGSGAVRFMTEKASLRQQVATNFTLGLTVGAAIFAYAIWSKRRGTLR